MVVAAAPTVQAASRICVQDSVQWRGTLVQHRLCLKRLRLDERRRRSRCHGVTIGGIAGDSPASAAPSSRDDLPLLRRRTGFVSPSADVDAVAIASPPPPPLPHPPEFIVDSISASEGAGLAFLMESLSPRTVEGRIRRALGMAQRTGPRRKDRERECVSRR